MLYVWHGSNTVSAGLTLRFGFAQDKFFVFAFLFAFSDNAEDNTKGISGIACVPAR